MKINSIKVNNKTRVRLSQNNLQKHNQNLLD